MPAAPDRANVVNRIIRAALAAGDNGASLAVLAGIANTLDGLAGATSTGAPPADDTDQGTDEQHPGAETPPKKRTPKKTTAKKTTTKNVAKKTTAKKAKKKSGSVRNRLGQSFRGQLHGNNALKAWRKLDEDERSRRLDAAAAKLGSNASDEKIEAAKAKLLAAVGSKAAPPKKTPKTKTAAAKPAEATTGAAANG